LPFDNAMRVAFDPADAGRIYVTTFGGSVWHGPTPREEAYTGEKVMVPQAVLQTSGHPGQASAANSVSR